MTDQRRRMRRQLTDLRTHPHAYIKVPAFAVYLDVQPKTVMKWIKTDLLRAYQFEGEWRIKTVDAIAFVEKARFQVS